MRVSALENSSTLGAEYYAPEIIALQNRLRDARGSIQPLRDISVLITDGDHGAADYQQTGIPFILSEAVREGWIDTSQMRYISERHHKRLPRSSLKSGDVLVTKTGAYFGNSAVVPENFGPANTIAHVGRIVLKGDYNPYYIATFLNSKYGYAQLRRRGIKATRPEIKLIELDDIEIFVPSELFQTRIEMEVQKSLALREKVAKSIRRAQESLLDALGLRDWTPPNSLTYTRKASEVLESGRWDSQFFKPAVDDLRGRLLGRFELGALGAIGEVLNGRTVPYSDDGQIPIIRSGDLGDIEAEFKFLRAGEDQSVFFLERGDVLLSSIGFGSIGKAEVFDKVGRFGTVSEVTVIRQNTLDPYYMAALLRSQAGQVQIERFITGATGQLHLYPRDVAKIFVPMVPTTLQAECRRFAERARVLRAAAREILSRGKRAVEIAVEDSEEAARRFLDEPGHQP